MKSKIIILSNSVQTGKTSNLLKWINGKQYVAGILTPDINNTRHLLDIENNTYYSFEINNHGKKDGITQIGKFNFSTKIFKLAQQIIKNKTNKEFLIIDEIGKLELFQDKGLEPVLSRVIKKYTKNLATGTLVLVIRDYLLEAAINKYHLHNAQIVKLIDEIDEPIHLLGLILAGGNSTRMKTDKAFLNYFGQPQIYHLAQKLTPICKPILLSVNNNQIVKKSEHYQVLYDSATYRNLGPIGALLTAFKAYPNKAFLVLGCDYPWLTYADIFLLKLAFEKHQKTVTFYNPETQLREPLLGIYHPNDLEKLPDFYLNGNTGLRFFLNEIYAIKVNPTHINSITSVDNEVDFNKTKLLINNSLS